MSRCLCGPQILRALGPGACEGPRPCLHLVQVPVWAPDPACTWSRCLCGPQTVCALGPDACVGPRPCVHLVQVPVRAPDPACTWSSAEYLLPRCLSLLNFVLPASPLLTTLSYAGSTCNTVWWVSPPWFENPHITRTEGCRWSGCAPRTERYLSWRYVTLARRGSKTELV